MYFSGHETLSRQRVAIIVNPKIAKLVLGYHSVNSRIISIKINANSMNLNIIQVYAPTSEAAEDEIEEFYSALEQEILRMPTREVTMVFGYFNAKVGSLRPTEDHLRRVLGRNGLGKRNERGERLLSFCAERKLTILNTTFTHHPRRLYTWKSPRDRYRNQIDFILVPQRWQQQ
jgi:exonuclease III